MSIDAVVSGIQILPDDECKLVLEKRDRRTASGQTLLTISNPPEPRHRLGILMGCELWGSDDKILFGDKIIAHREGYTRIRLVDHWELLVSRKEMRTVINPPWEYP